MEGRNLPGATSLIEDLDKTVMVILRDGRHLVGKLVSFDQFSNLVLENAQERFYCRDMMASQALGCTIVRSDNIVLVAQIDEERDRNSEFKVVEVDALYTEKNKLEDEAEKKGTEPFVTLNDASLWDFDA